LIITGDQQGEEQKQQRNAKSNIVSFLVKLLFTPQWMHMSTFGDAS
jgi:hypothetical protein